MVGLAEAIGRRLGEQLGEDQDRQEVLAFGALAVLQNGTTVLLLLVLSWLTGTVWEAIAVAAASSFLRVVAGGAHLSTPWRCATFTAGMFWATGWLSAQSGPVTTRFGLWIAVPLILVNLLVLVRLAPVEAETRPLEAEHKVRLRRSSLIRGGLLSAGTLVGVTAGSWLGPALLMGFCTACLTLTPAGRQLVSLVDTLCNRVLRRWN